MALKYFKWLQLSLIVTVDCVRVHGTRYWFVPRRTARDGIESNARASWSTLLPHISFMAWIGMASSHLVCTWRHTTTRTWWRILLLTGNNTVSSDELRHAWAVGGDRDACILVPRFSLFQSFARRPIYITTPCLYMFLLHLTIGRSA